MFLTKEAVRLALPGYGEAVACDGCPPLTRLLQQYADGGGELLVCPICFTARKLDDAQLVPNAKLGAPPRSGSGSATSQQPSSATRGGW